MTRRNQPVSPHQGSLAFASKRMQMTESIQRTIDGLTEYGDRYMHWVCAISGGKDSSALGTLVTYLVLSGKVKRPKTLTLIWADTRMELVPLWDAAAVFCSAATTAAHGDSRTRSRRTPAPT